jgi:hypothetical protein
MKFRMMVYVSTIALLGCGTGPSMIKSPAKPQHRTWVLVKEKSSPEKIITKKPILQKDQVREANEKKPQEKKCDATCMRREERKTDFYAYLVEGRYKKVKKMLKKGMVSLKEMDNLSLLSAIEHPRMLRLLLRHGVDINTKNSDGETALMMQAYEGNYKVAREMIRNGADVKIKNTKAKTSAISYCTDGKLARLLIKKGADVNEKNIYGTTPLIYASSRSCNDVAKVLVENGADVNVNSPVVGTALMLASKLDNVELVKFLLSKGADVNARGTDYFDNKKRKKTALQLAKESDHTEVIKILEKSGAKK